MTMKIQCLQITQFSNREKPNENIVSKEKLRNFGVNIYLSISWFVQSSMIFFFDFEF